MPDTKLGSSVLELKTDSTKLNKGIDQGKKKTKELDKSFKDAGKSLAKFAGIAAAASLAIAGIVRIAGDLIETFKVQEVAQNALTAAIIASGKEASISARALIDYAGELQKVTLFGDEATISSMALLQSLADISEKGLKQIAPLVQDMATVLKMDLRTIGSLIGKTIGSTTNALTRYGIEIDMTGTKSEKFALLVKELENRFGGAAVAMGTTATGALVQLNNALGDLKELSGKAIAEGIEPIVRWLTDVAIEAHAAQKEINLVNEALRGTVGTTAEDQQATLNALLAERAKIETSTNTMVRARARTLDDEIAALRETLRWTTFAQQATAKSRAEAEIMLDFLDKIAVAEQDIAKFNLDRLDPAIREAEILQIQIDRFAELRAQAILYGEEYAAIQEHINNLVAARDELLDSEPFQAVVDLTGTMGEHLNEVGTILEGMPPFIEEISEEAKQLTEDIEGWMAPLSAFTNQAVMAFGTLAVEGAASAEAFGSAMKDALAGVLEALGQMLSVQALAAWAASFVPGGQGNIPSAIAYSAAAGAAFLGAGVIRALAHGGDFFTSGPELVMVGDNPGGRERVQVDPVSSGGRGDEIPVHIQIMVAEDVIIDTVARASRNRTLVLDARSITNR